MAACLPGQAAFLCLEVFRALGWGSGGGLSASAMLNLIQHLVDDEAPAVELDPESSSGLRSIDRQSSLLPLPEWGEGILCHNEVDNLMFTLS